MLQTISGWIQFLCKEHIYGERIICLVLVCGLNMKKDQSIKSVSIATCRRDFMIAV